MESHLLVAFIIVILIIVIHFTVHKSGTSGNMKLIWFFRKGCGWCSRMEPEWNRFLQMPNRQDLQIEKISTIENPEMAKDFGVSGVPHIVKVTNMGERIVYEGDRSAESLYKFSNKD
jgi:thiol-disulfide isomerase/thioredoxin